jgi:hypothetical protein
MFWSFTNVCKSVTIFGYNLIILTIDSLYTNYVCSCAASTVNLYRSQQCVELVMYRSMEHIFRVSGLENSCILQHVVTNFCEHTRIMARYAYATINPLNAELNPICHLLALLEAHHILHVSRIKVNLLAPEFYI